MLFIFLNGDEHNPCRAAASRKACREPPRRIWRGRHVTAEERERGGRGRCGVIPQILSVAARGGGSEERKGEIGRAHV